MLTSIKSSMVITFCWRQWTNNLGASQFIPENLYDDKGNAVQRMLPAAMLGSQQRL